jgi:hypothetical protein
MVTNFNKNMNIIQIGANRGNDDLSQIIGNNQPDKLILVEPMSLHNEFLLNHYGWVKNLSLENLIIDIESNKDVEFFYHLDDGPGYEVASLSKEHIYVKHIQLSPDRISSLILKTITINDLFIKHNLNNIDVLFIDAEGHDDTIIRSIDFDKFKINKIYFENLHLKDDSIYEFLNNLGYQITEKTGTYGWCSLAEKKQELVHFYNELGGENWFNYENFYSYVIDKLPNDSKMVEIGSWMGKSISYFVMESLIKNKKIDCTCVDIWEPYDEIKNHTVFETVGAFEQFLKNTEKIQNYITPIKGNSVEVSNKFKDKSFDFIFIDAAHDYDSVYKDLVSWYPKLKDGGIISGHDYYYDNDVALAVNDFFKDREIKINGPCWYII